MKVEYLKLGYRQCYLFLEFITVIRPGFLFYFFSRVYNIRKRHSNWTIIR